MATNSMENQTNPLGHARQRNVLDKNGTTGEYGYKQRARHDIQKRPHNADQKGVFMLNLLVAFFSFAFAWSSVVFRCLSGLDVAKSFCTIRDL